MTTPQQYPQIKDMDALEVVRRFQSGDPIQGSVDAGTFLAALQSQLLAATAETGVELHASTPAKPAHVTMAHATNTAVPLAQVKVGDIVWIQVAPSSIAYKAQSPEPKQVVAGFHRSPNNLETHARLKAVKAQYGKSFGTPTEMAGVAHEVVAVGMSTLQGVGQCATVVPMWETARVFTI